MAFVKNGQSKSLGEVKVSPPRDDPEKAKVSPRKDK